MEYPLHQPESLDQQHLTPLHVKPTAKAIELWDEYMADERSFDDVYELWSDTTIDNPTIRQRAVVVLTAPPDFPLPYPHPKTSISRLIYQSEIVGGREVRPLRERLADRPELALQLAAALYYWLLEIDSGKVDAAGCRSDYQYAVQQLMPLIPEEAADDLFFDHFDPVDHTASPADVTAFYRPSETLLIDSQIVRKYKDHVLSAWINDAGQKKSDVALASLIAFLPRWIYLNTDVELQTQVVTFLETHLPKESAYLHIRNVRPVAERLADPDIKFGFVLRHLSAAGTEFGLANQEEYELLKWFTAEARNRKHPQAINTAKTAIANYEAQQQMHEQAKKAQALLQKRLRSK